MKATINHLNIDYRDQGSGVPVIFIHAFPLNQTMWDEQVAALSHRCRAITLGLRGFGGSDVADGPATMEQMAADVRSLMSTLDIERATLVGLSMGGYVSLAFYREYPDAVRALVLADTRASGDTHAARERRLQSAEKAERQGAATIADDMVPLLLGKTTQQARPDIAARVREMIEGNSPQGIAAAQRGMAARRDSTYMLAAIDFPTLIIVGAEDTLTPLAEAEAMRDGIRGARLQVIAGAGHLSNIERPQEFNAALSEFIESLAAE
ncbi:MAG TPA: alpha/beta fold hydrolase [Blastocatellia bacterium]|nr:alpha/beta fold hydrolase [Blastocatellia bacterium]